MGCPSPPWVSDVQRRKLQIRRQNQHKKDKNAEILSIAKSAPCADCGLCYPPYVMQFDHRPDSEKKFTISQKKCMVGQAVLRTEIAKCDVVCANCHFHRTQCRIMGVVPFPLRGFSPHYDDLTEHGQAEAIS